MRLEAYLCRNGKDMLQSTCGKEMLPKSQLKRDPQKQFPFQFIELTSPLAQ
ncbi:hypothetical protein [Paenibacillus sp. FSL H7-0331]|uniref:hypothetical protein n=1 Tax=Paenibacillus sp. FSL H7-0331 TaxID=1920421 RepID=UPI0015C3EA40|nr:hypothetical protein [Paenibacillus sp. FSL H7-0331]